MSDPVQHAGEDRLIDELLLGEGPDPHLMARYADDPGALTPHERAEIEAYLARSPRARDELRVLQRFDVRAPERPRALRSAPAPRGRFLRRGLRVALPLAVAAAAVVAVVLGGPWRERAGPQEAAPQIARAPGIPSPEPPPSAVPAEPPRPQPPAPQAAPETPAPARAEPTPPPAPEPVERPGPVEPTPQEPVYVALLEPEYAPPWDLEARTRVASEVRGAEDLPRLLALAPEHVARTSAARPTLLWYVSSLPPGGEWQLVLADPQAIDPLIRRSLPAPQRAGVQRIELDADLAPGVEYEWSIVWRRDPRNPASDVIGQGWLRRVELPAGLQAELGARPAYEHAALYARAGFWYDALAELDRAHRQFPGETGPRRALAVLLAGIGLPELELTGW